MGDAFRGLTIRLGADARPLNSAINSIKASAQAAQKQLNAMNKALKFDSTNVAAMGARIELMGDRATHAARAARLIRISMDQASEKTKKLAASTTDAFAQTQKLRSQYTHVNAELQHIYDAAKRAAVASEDFGKITSFEKANKFVNALKNNLDDTGEKGKKARAILTSLITSATKTTDIAEAFGFEKGVASATKLLDTFKRLRSEQAKLQGKLEDMNAVEGYRTMQTQLIAYESELRQAVSEIARFKSELFALGSEGQLAKVVSDLKRVDEGLDQARSSAARMNDAFKAMPKSESAALARFRAFRAEIASTEDKITMLRQKLHQIESEKGFSKLAAQTGNVYAAFSRAETQVADFEYKLKDATSRMAELKAKAREFAESRPDGWREEIQKIRAQMVGAREEVRRYTSKVHEADAALKSAALEKEWRETYEAEVLARSELEKINARTSKMSMANDVFRTLRTAGYGLYSTITPALMMIGRYGVQSANEIDSAYRDMRKTVNGTEEEFEHLKDAALEFSTTHVTSADTILEIEAMGGQLGIAVENLESFSETVSNLDIATDIDAEDMAKYIGQLSNIMDDINTQDAETYQRNITSFSDALVRLGNNSAAQESSIMKVMMRIASLGNISGFTTPQLLAISTAVAATGQGCEAAGTAISRTFSNIEAAVGAGGDKLQAFADVAGMSAQDFADAWNDDPIVAFKAFIEGLKRIDEEGGSVDNTLASLKINSVRQKQALEGLTNTVDVLNNSLGMSQDAWNGVASVIGEGKIEEAGDAAREAQRKSEGFSGALKMMKNNAQLLASVLAEGAAPIIYSLGDLFHSLTESIKGLPDGFKTLAVGVGVFFAALGPGLVSIGAIGSGVTTLHDIIQKISASSVWTSATGKVSTLRTELALTGALAQTSGSKIGKFAGFLSKISPAQATIGIMAAVAAFQLVSAAIEDARKKAEDYQKATVGIYDAVLASSPYARAVSGDLEAVGKAAEKTAINYRELVESQAKLVDTIAERNKNGQAEIDLLQQARNTIHELTNKTDEYGNKVALTSEEQGRLRLAIKTVNDECNTSLSVIDAENGVIAEQGKVLGDACGKIDEYISKKQQQIQADVIAQNYADTYKQHVENIKAMADAQNSYNEAFADYESAGGDLNKNNPFAEEFATATTNLKTAEETLNGTSVALDFLTGQMNAAGEASEKSTRTFANLVQSSGEWAAAFNDTEMFTQFVDGLKTAGISVEEFDKIGVDGMLAVADAFKTSNGDIELALQAIGLTTGSLKDQMALDFSQLGVNWETFVSSFGGNADMLAQKLEAAGGAAQLMAGLTAEQIASLMEESGYNIDVFIEKLQQIGENQVNVEGEVNLDSNADEVEADVDEAYAEAEGGASGEVDINDDSVIEATDDTQNLGEEVNNLPDSKDINVSVSGNASGVLSDIYWYLTNMPTSKEVTVTTHKVGDAKGGFYALHAAGGRFKLHGSGSFITSGPTVLGSDRYGYVHIAGEAGREWVKRHADGTTSIVPIENRRYLKPYAREIAGMIGGAGTTNYYITLDYKAGDDANKIFTDFTRMVKMQSRLGA